jgi:hypothetical protein
MKHITCTWMNGRSAGRTACRHAFGRGRCLRSMSPLLHPHLSTFSPVLVSSSLFTKYTMLPERPCARKMNQAILRLQSSEQFASLLVFSALTYLSPRQHNTFSLVKLRKHARCLCNSSNSLWKHKSPTDLQTISRQLARTLSPCGCHNVPHLYAQRQQYLVSKYVCYGLQWTKHTPPASGIAALLTLRSTQGIFILFLT